MKGLATFALALLVAGCTTMGDTMTDKARAELAPTGKLRAGMNLGNVLFTQKDAKSGEIVGVSVDIMNELGRRLGVPVEMVMHATPGEVADAVDRNTWDVAILAIEQSRAEKIAFTPGMTEIEVGFLVPKDSRLRHAREIDQPGVRIAVSEKAGYEGPLMRSVKHAKPVSVKGGTSGTFDAFQKQNLEAYIALKPVLMDLQPKMPGSRVLEGNFMTVQHGLGTPRARAAGAEYLKKFVEDMIASGFIARSIEKHRVRGLNAVRPS